MWYGQMPPWMQRQGMTPGAGMPPYGQNAPMSMQPREMRPGGALARQHPPMQAARQPMDPAQIGMLAAMLAKQTPKPGSQALGPMAAAASGVAASGALGGLVSSMASPSGAPQMTPAEIARMYYGVLGPGLLGGGV